jgi:hypothetical protein
MKIKKELSTIFIYSLSVTKFLNLLKSESLKFCKANEDLSEVKFNLK